MRLFVPVALVLLLMTACGSTTDPVDVGSTDTSRPTQDSTTTPESEPTPPDQIAADPMPAVMAAALRNLILKDHTFGSGPPPFTEYLVVANVDAGAGDAMVASQKGRELTGEEKAKIKAAISDFGPIRFIDNADDFRTADLTPTVEGAAILSVAMPEISGGSALIGVSLWCGGTCATWLTYRIELVDSAWTVTGTDGPVSIS